MATIHVKFTNTPSDDTLRAYAEEKVAAFAKLLDSVAFDAAKCDVEFRRSTHHRTGDVCYAEVTLRAGGKVYRSSKEESTLTKAIDKVKDDILEELRVDKRRAAHERAKGREVKDLLRQRAR